MGILTNATKVIFASVVMLMLVSAALANSPSEPTIVVGNSANLGIIKGIVRDEGGSPIAEASVAIFRDGTSKLLKQVTSGRDGSFLAKILPGTYTVLAVAQGFNPVTLFGVEIGRASELTYGFKLERAGAGNTLPEKKLDRNSSKWRIRAAQMQRAIYQNREGEDGAVASVENGTDEVADEPSKRKGQAVVETYFGGTSLGNYTGANFAALLPMGDDTDVVVAAQIGKGRGAPQRFETSVSIKPLDGHKFRFSAAGTKIGGLKSDRRQLGQVSFQAVDEWKVREGIIVVYGFDYSRFVGAGDASSFTPRLGLQFDLDSRTRLRSAFTGQTEERSWARAIDLEGQSVAFSEPVAIEDLFTANGRPQMNKSRRLELGIERILDSRSSVEANVFLDTTSGRGVGLNNFSFDSLGEDGLGDFVANQQGKATGLRVVYTRRVNNLLTASAGYAFGNGQKLSEKGFADPAGIFENDFFQSFFGQLSTDLKTGTSVRTIFRLSPQATVFAIDPFKGRLAIYDPGLSVFVTQHLPNLGLPFRAEAIIDARNILDFQAGVFADEGGLRVNAMRRMLRGGIQVRF